jgi:hypothetical protein
MMIDNLGKHKGMDLVLKLITSSMQMTQYMLNGEN